MSQQSEPEAPDYRGVQKELYDACKRMVAMLDDPHPGLSSWHKLLNDSALELRSALLKLWPIETDDARRRRVSVLEEQTAPTKDGPWSEALVIDIAGVTAPSDWDEPMFRKHYRGGVWSRERIVEYVSVRAHGT